MPTSLGLDPEGEQGGSWFGQSQITTFAAAIKPHVTRDVRVLLFSCNTGIGTDDPALGMPDPNASGAGKGSFAAQLADAPGDDATVYAHNTKGHAETNPFASVFKAGKGAREEMFNKLYLTKADKDATRRAASESAATAASARRCSWTRPGPPRKLQADFKDWLTDDMIKSLK